MRTQKKKKPKPKRALGIKATLKDGVRGFFRNWVSHPGPHKAKNLSVPASFEEELPRLSSKRIKK